MGLHLGECACYSSSATVAQTAARTPRWLALLFATPVVLHRFLWLSLLHTLVIKLEPLLTIGSEGREGSGWVKA